MLFLVKVSLASALIFVQWDQTHLLSWHMGGLYKKMKSHIEMWHFIGQQYALAHLKLSDELWV